MDSAQAVSDPAQELAVSGLPAGVVFVSVDVESDPGRDDRIFRIGAVRSDREATLDVAVARSSREAVVRRLNAFAAGADIVAGHNLRRHDLPALVGQFSGLALRELPVVDTLELSTRVPPAVRGDDASQGDLDDVPRRAVSSRSASRPRRRRRGRDHSPTGVAGLPAATRENTACMPISLRWKQAIR